MATETRSFPNPSVIAWMDKFDWGTGSRETAAKQSAFPVVDLMDWLRRTDSGNFEGLSFIVSVTGSSAAYGYTPQALYQSSEQIGWERMKAAAQDANETEFIAAAKTIDWENCMAEDYINAVRLALSATAYLKARLLATDGANRYPEDAELQKYARVLAPPKVLPNHTPADPAIRKDRDWLMEHGDEYRGQWVALRRGEFLGAAPALKDLIQEIGDPRGKNILVTQV